MTRKLPSGQSEPDHHRRSTERSSRASKSAPSLLNTMIENLLGDENPEITLNRELKSGTLQGRQKTAERILETIHELDSLSSFGKKIAFLNSLAESGKLPQDIYSALSRAVVRHDVRSQNPNLEAQLPLKWAQYWRGTNRLVDEIEKGGLITLADIDDVRRRFDQENQQLRNAVRDRIGGTLLKLLEMSESEQRKKRYSVERMLTATELLFGDEQSRVWRAAYALASFLHERGEFSLRKTEDGTPSPLSLGTMALLAERTAPILREARWSVYKKEESEITPEQRGMLASASAQILSFLTRVNFGEFEKERAKELLDNQRSDARIIKIAQELKGEEETVDQDMIRANAEEQLDSVRKVRLAQRITTKKQSCKQAMNSIRSATYADPDLARTMLNVVRSTDEIDDLLAAHAAIQISASRERRMRARVEEQIERETASFERIDEALRYGSLDAHLRAKELIDTTTEQRRQLSEHGERRSPSGKAGRLRRKLALIEGQLKRCALYRKRLEPLQAELQKSRKDTQIVNGGFEKQLTELREQLAKLTSKKRPAKTDAAKIEKLQGMIERVEGEYHQAQNTQARTQEYVQRQIDSLQAVIDQEEQFKADRDAKVARLEKVRGKLHSSIPDDIRAKEHQVEKLLEQDKLYSVSAKKHADITEDEDTVDTDHEEQEREIRIYLFNSNRHRVHDNEAEGEIYVDLVMEQIALEQEQRELRRGEIARVRSRLYEGLSLRYGSNEDKEFMQAKNEILKIAYDSGARNDQNYRESSEIYETLRAAMMERPGDALLCDAYGPQVIVNGIRIRIPKRLALAFAESCFTDWETRINTIRAEVQDAYAKGDDTHALVTMRKNALPLWHFAQLDATIKLISSYNPSRDQSTFNRQRTSFKERELLRAHELNKLREETIRGLLPKFEATVLSRVASFTRQNDQTTPSFKQNVMKTLTIFFERLKGESDLVSYVNYPPYLIHDILDRDPDTFAYFYEVHPLVKEIFDDIFPSALFEMSEADSDSSYNDDSYYYVPGDDSIAEVGNDGVTDEKNNKEL